MKFTLCLLATAALASAAVHPEMLVSTEWLAQHATDTNVVILHVAANRTIYDTGHIPGARFLPLTELAVTVNGVHNEFPPVADLKRLLETAGVSDASRVILYSDAAVLPATRTYFTLDYLGHAEKTSLLDGGLEKWRSEGRSLSKESPASKPSGVFTPRLRPEVLAPLETVKQLSAKPASAEAARLVDVRAPADFQGEKGAHIPNAMNAFWMENQVSRENQALKPEAALRKQLEALGLTPGKSIVTYCNSGMQATQTYFTLKYLGYDVRMYDGSLSEWNARGGQTEK
jgi:thiosulfate/3-mercaptopyruvate sulfurtransferase